MDWMKCIGSLILTYGLNHKLWDSWETKHISDISSVKFFLPGKICLKSWDSTIKFVHVYQEHALASSMKWLKLVFIISYKGWDYQVLFKTGR